MAIIYGIDTDQPVLPMMVRDALVQCFFKAHCEDTGLDFADAKSSQSYCASIVKKAFEDSEGNFDHPTKDELVRAIGKLMEFSKNFRDPSIVQKHAGEIQMLLDKIK